MNNVSITASGFYVPENIVTNKDLEKTLDTTDAWIVEKTGIKERRIAPEEMLTSELAAKAAINTLENSAVAVEDIDLIVLATNMSDHLSPACAVRVQEKIGAVNAAAFDIRVGGCPGIIYAMSIAYQYIASGTYKTVLALSADMNSKVVNWEDRKTCVFLGDGASGFVLQQTENSGIQQIKLHTNPKGYYDAYIPAGGIEEPITVDNVQTGRQYFTMNGRAIWEYATTVFPATVHELLEASNTTLDDIDFVVSHQANLNIIKEGLRQLEVPLEKTYINVDKYANTGGSSVGIALAEGIEKNIIKKGNKIIIVAFGAGYSWGGMLLDLNALKN